MIDIIATYEFRTGKGHIAHLQVHELPTGKFVVVVWNEFHHQYQTAPFRACEVPQGGYRYGRRPGDVGHHISRAYALREFRRIRAELRDEAEALDIDQD